MKRFVLALSAAFLLIPATASAAPGGQALVDDAASYLQQAQNSDGGFGGAPSGESDPTFTSWAAIALAAAGINPSDQRLPGGKDALSYLRDNIDQVSVTPDFERTLLAAVAAGDSGRNFGGRDLVATILSRQRADGSFPHVVGGSGTINATAFAVLSLAGTNDRAHDPEIARAVTWLRSKQNPSGGFGWAPGVASDPDMTAAVLQALRAAGLNGTDTEQRALDYLRGAQRADGGFSLTPGAESNTPSTAWVVQALWACGLDPADWNKSGNSPLDFIVSMQRSDGSFRESAKSNGSPVWMTAYALPAFAGRPLPISTVPESNSESSPPKGSDPPQVGHVGGRQSGGVTGGSGGAGAKPFTRPRPGGKADRRNRPDRELRNTKPSESSPATESNGAVAAEPSLAKAATKGRAPDGAVSVADGGEIVTGLPLSLTSAKAGPAASGLRTAVKDSTGGSATWFLLLGIGIAFGAGFIVEFRPVR